MESFRTNFPAIRNFPDSVIEILSFREISNLSFKKDKGSKVFSQTLAANFENLQKFPTRVPAGEDNCTGIVHEARFLRGYAASDQNLWLQARKKLNLNGIEPISNYDTNSVNISDKISCKVWGEIHNPSSKELSIRMLSTASMKSAWDSPEKGHSLKEFESIQELRVAVSALETGIHKVFPWNFSFKALAVFLTDNNYGQTDLSSNSSRLSFLNDFVDGVIRSNAQNWDEGKPFLSHDLLQARWSASLAQKIPLQKRTERSETFQKKSTQQSSGPPMSRTESTRAPKPRKEEKTPMDVCRNFNLGRCQHTSDSHPAYWDLDFKLNHVCSEYLPDKKRFCRGKHPKTEHK
jgi:hypothetical protein